MISSSRFTRYMRVMVLYLQGGNQGIERVMRAGIRKGASTGQYWKTLYVQTRYSKQPET